MKEDIRKRIDLLREKMAERGMDAYLIPTDDFHGSEYVGDYFKCREYMTGFTGSAGTMVVTMEEAGLWTDGRYFVQARRELAGSGVRLFEMGQEGVPTVSHYLAKNMPSGGVLGFDGRVVDGRTGDELGHLLEEKKITLSVNQDLVGQIWENRPSLSAEPVWILPEKYAGRSSAEKVADIRLAMKKKRATIHILTNLEDIVWLLNIRGGDVPCTPVVLSYLIVTRTDLMFFVNKNVLSLEVSDYLTKMGVRIFPYTDVYGIVKTFKYETVLLEKSRVNYLILSSLDSTVNVLDAVNPTALAKAVKNPAERENMRMAHIKDGVAMAKFIFWLKNSVKCEKLDESTAAEYLDELRKKQEGSLGLSFETISAYGPNAAMCHYKASKETASLLRPEGLYLVDSGGQYLEGTTDVTRTIALGPVGEQEKEYCTLVAAGMLRLLNVKFPYGCHGFNLDYAARELFWSRGLDFNHGTGHGVGYLGSVHERPCGIRWRVAPEKLESENAVLEEGMIMSDEPGLYLEGKFGVRTENMMLCIKDTKNDFGQFMRFENLTWVPIDLDTIDPSILEERDKKLLNEYHRQVYEKISPYLNDEESAWLKQATRAI